MRKKFPKAAALACCLLLFAAARAEGQRRGAGQPRTSPPPQTAPAPASADAKGAQVLTDAEFRQLASQADAAREGERIEEAVALYRRGVEARADWAEGRWYLATLYYEQQNYAEAARFFRETARLQPKVAAAWALLGLCEFQLGDYDEALQHIAQGRALGVADNVELTRVMRYHEGLLMLLKGDFERAQQTLGTLSFEGLKTEDIIIALGLSALRRGMLPRQVPPGYEDRDLIRRVGLAEHFAAQRNVADAAREYELVVRDYAKTPGVQYAYGRYLLANRDDDGALVAFQREVENYPRHALARLQIAYIKLKNRDAQAGLSYAEEAVKLYPRLPLSHFVLGRILLETGQTARAISELEAVQRMAPDYAPTYFQLSRAYSKANRRADAERARETFTTLSKKAEEATAAQQGQNQPRGDGLPAEDSEPAAGGAATTPPKP